MTLLAFFVSCLPLKVYFPCLFVLANLLRYASSKFKIGQLETISSLLLPAILILNTLMVTVDLAGIFLSGEVGRALLLVSTCPRRSNYVITAKGKKTSFESFKDLDLES